MKRISYIFLAAALPFLIGGCAAQRRIQTLQEGRYLPSITLTKAQDFIPDISKDLKVRRDTFTIRDGDREILIMKAIKDEDGQMVAHDVIDAAVVTARFRNVAERNGRVDIEFQIIVPREMQDPSWQLRFYPKMIILEDTVALEKVIITGEEYRRKQLKGYEQYEKFLSTIIADNGEFVNWWLLEKFLERNIPQVYAFKTDSTYVSDEQFASAYGVTEQEAVEHYTNTLARRANERRKARKDDMYRRYVKVPIESEGLRLDTVIATADGDFIYRYVQPVKTRPRLRKVDVLIDGDIFQEDERIYDIPQTDPLTFYISSLSAFVDNRERYMTKVIERRVSANTSCYIDFEHDSHEVDEHLSHNASEIARIEANLLSLMQNEVFDLDSIVVSSYASPEGTVRYNDRLSRRRSEGISDYFGRWMKDVRDSLDREKGFMIDIDGKVIVEKQKDIPMRGHSKGENWRMLDRLIQEDTLLTEEDKQVYFESAELDDLDLREESFRGHPWYLHLREKLYPRLRTVRFDFHLHRKGMVKDTVHTTVLDTTYMNGVQAIRDRDYETAVTLLRPYGDYNCAVAFLCMDYNASALQILEELERTAQVNYMLAVLHSRMAEERKAVECYVRSCSQDPSYIHRGNLDPEIAVLIRRYGLNAQNDDETDYTL